MWCGRSAAAVAAGSTLSGQATVQGWDAQRLAASLLLLGSLPWAGAVAMMSRAHISAQRDLRCAMMISGGGGGAAAVGGQLEGRGLQVGAGRRGGRNGRYDKGAELGARSPLSQPAHMQACTVLT